MYSALCHSGSWGYLGDWGIWGGAGLILGLVVWVGLLAGLILLIVWAIRRAPVRAAAVSSAAGQLTAKEILQARYARGEITREQYERTKNDIG